VHVTLIILAAIVLLLSGLLGVLLTAVTLPGVWLTLVVALLCQWLFGPPPLFNWWTLIACAGLALAGEVFEFVSGAIGAKRAGGGKSGALGSIIGAFGGAIIGSFALPIPLIGTLVGAVLGAGIGALIAERGVAGREWSHAFRIGQSAAASRLAATVVKVAIAAAVAAVLTVAALVP
jgi:uncharacterized protein YqgC (DUF456 family)